MKRGAKRSLDFTKAASENQAACDGLFSDLAGRGLDLRQVHLNIIDGSQSLRAGARKWRSKPDSPLPNSISGATSLGHFADEEQPGWDRRLANAYDLRSYREAKAAFLRIQRLRKRAKTGIRLGART